LDRNDKVKKMLQKNDMKILEMMKENCRAPAKEIGQKTGIPITTICNRIRKMESEGVIRKYRAVVDNNKVGNPVEAFIRIDVGRNPEKLVEQLINRPEVEECYVVSGSIEVLLKAAFSDMKKMHDFISALNSRNIVKITAQVILRNVDKPNQVFIR